MDESTTVRRLKEAILAQQDELAEKLVQRLKGDDEAALVDMANSESGDMQWWAVRSLALVGSDACIAAVDRALHSPDSALRAAGALAIAHLHSRCPEATKDSMATLAGMLSDDDGLVRQAAADSLAMCGNDAVDALAEVIDALHDGARARAAYSLRKIATVEAGALLYPLLDDPNHLVRSYAYDGLDAIGAFENIVVD